MCEYCHSFPRRSGCPAAPEPRTVYKCSHCGEGIAEGEEYITLEDKRYHVECVEDIGVVDVLRLLGIETEEACLTTREE